MMTQQSGNTEGDALMAATAIYCGGGEILFWSCDQLSPVIAEKSEARQEPRILGSRLVSTNNACH